MEDTRKWTDERLVAEAESGLRGQGSVIEAMRRLRMSIEGFSTSSDTYSRRMFALNIILTVLTLVQVAAVVKAWL